MLHVAATIHKDDENYTNPDIFDGFRFANMDVPEGDDGKQQMVCVVSLMCDGVLIDSAPTVGFY